MKHSPAQTTRHRSKARSLWSYWLLLLGCLALIGCGGGGGGGDGGTGGTYNLTITKTGCGTGIVTSNPSGISCRSTDCAEVYISGTTITLTPTPDVDSSFEGWNGGGCSGKGNCVFDIAADTVVSAEFGKPDPLYIDQWHLKNTGQGGGLPGEDINAEPVWSAGTKGNSIRIAVVDDGLEIAHEDLTVNVVPGKSWDYVGGDTDPTGGAHGTSVAGLAAARDGNCLGVVGAAPRAEMVGYNLLQASISANEADAMTRDMVDNSISSNSWGAADGNGTLDASSLAWKSAINTGLVSGRNNRGTIYAWAAGNGAPRDNSNYDGRANYRGVIAVAALDDAGNKASYSERGANLWVSAPAGEFCSTHTLTTTDRSGEDGYNDSGTAGISDYADKNYTKCFNGTSGATPIVSGTVALMLEANPNLGWRDVRQILARTARMNDPSDPEWVITTAPYHFNHNYGFGVVDANAAVNLAKTWTNVGQERTYTTTTGSPNLAIPDNNATGVSHSINVSGSSIEKIEWVEVTLTAPHTYSGDLEIILTSPVGAQSRLAETHTCADGACSSYSGWVFGSARHLGEAADGQWTLRVADKAPPDTGTFQSWQIKFYGTGAHSTVWIEGAWNSSGYADFGDNTSSLSGTFTFNSVGTYVHNYDLYNSYYGYIGNYTLTGSWSLDGGVLTTDIDSGNFDCSGSAPDNATQIVLSCYDNLWTFTLTR